MDTLQLQMNLASIHSKQNALFTFPVPPFSRLVEHNTDCIRFGLQAPLGLVCVPSNYHRWKTQSPLKTDIWIQYYLSLSHIHLVPRSHIRSSRSFPLKYTQSCIESLYSTSPQSAGITLQSAGAYARIFKVNSDSTLHITPKIDRRC